MIPEGLTSIVVLSDRVTKRRCWIALITVTTQGGRPLHRKLLLLLLSLFLDFFQLAASFLFLHDHEVLEETVGEVLAHLFEGARSELVVVILLVEVPVETGFKRETVHNIELSPHDDAGSLKFRLLQAEATRMIPELGGLLGKQFRDDPHLQILFGV